MSVFLRRYWSVVLVAAWSLAWCGTALATPANKAAFERHFDRFLAKSLAACTTCHLPSDNKNPESLEEFPHNPFGDAVRKAGRHLLAEGKRRDMESRLLRIAADDSDGDGVDNQTEILLGHRPGDASDHPTPAELATIAPRRDAFATFLKSYKWRPFEPATRPAVPSAAGARNPIDAFVAEQWAMQGLHPVGEATRHVLLRRVYLDLIGLSPTPAEIEAFEKDDSADAYEKVVDRLLADPRYGERWGRHWMDVWRYSDWAGWTDGGQIRDSQPHIWRWRDWIVESLNSDKPYDRMILEMLAADELCPEDESALRATGFLARNYKMLSREQWLEDTLNHSSRALLGMTLHCAKCHDHPFDPVTQEEYYKMRAVFEPHNVRIDLVPGVTDKKVNGLPRVYDKELDARTYLYTRGDERTPDKARGEMKPGVPAVFGGELKVEPVSLPFRAAHPDRREFVRKDLVAEGAAGLEEVKKKYEATKDDAKLSQRQRSEAEASLAAAQAKYAATAAMIEAERLEDAGRKGTPEWKTIATQALIAQRNGAVAEATVDLLSAQTALDKDAKDAKAREKLEKATKALAKAAAELNEPPSGAYKSRPMDDFPEKSTGRRLALARWLVDAKNPRTSRVAVNQIWSRHFAMGLVPTTDDFGRGGRPATHPALLDWLASELISSGWSMKHIHRLIVTSRTYRLASTPDSSDARIDPDDAFLWRFPSKRMEAELVRDNVLWAAGSLDLAMGGPEIDHKQGLASRRRSIYLRIAPEKEVEFLKIFDGPNPNECYVRRASVMPHQALALANSELVLREAKGLAKKLAGGDDAFIVAGFERILARPPTPEEASACRAFLADAKDPARGRENLVIVLFNHNDFVTIR
jgi:hypothetical protein